MYKIHVENIRTKSYHGCLKEEGVIGGEYRADVWVKLKDSYRVSKDELEETVDYGLVTKIAVSYTHLTLPTNSRV